MYLAKKKYRPRIQGLKRIHTLNGQLETMKELTQELKADKEVALSQVIALRQSIEKLVADIKVFRHIKL